MMCGERTGHQTIDFAFHWFIAHVSWFKIHLERIEWQLCCNKVTGLLFWSLKAYGKIYATKVGNYVQDLFVDG